MQRPGARRRPPSVAKLLSRRHPAGCDKGTFVQAMAKRLAIATDAVSPLIGDMQTDLPMFRRAACRSRWQTRRRPSKGATLSRKLERGRGVRRCGGDNLEDEQERLVQPRDSSRESTVERRATRFVFATDAGHASVTLFAALRR